MKAIPLCTVLLALAGFGAEAQKPYAGVATGNIVVDGKPIPLKYAYVVDVDNVEEAGMPMPGARKSIVIVLSDRALPATGVMGRDAPFAERRSPAQIMAPTGKNPVEKAFAIVLKLEPNRANPLSARFLYPGADSIEFTVGGTEYPDRVVGMKRAGDYLAGTAFAPNQATRLRKGPKKYQYRATFRAPILTEQPVKENIDGAAALASAPVAALRAYLEAGKKGDRETLRKLTAATHQSYLSNKEFLASLKSAEMEKLAEQVKRVVVRGDTAAIVVVNETPNISQVTMHLVRDRGEWKLCWP